jgi:hypothetical protein
MENQVQSIIFDRNRWDIPSAIYLIYRLNTKNGYKKYVIPDWIDIKPNFLRFRQFDPIYNGKTKYWTNKSKKYPGVEFIIMS